MRLEAKKLLHDVAEACTRLRTFSAGKSFEDYSADALLRSAVERQFEIVGEALRQLADLDAEMANGIQAHRRFIAFRNILIHGYARVDDRLVWKILSTRVEPLESEVRSLLRADP